MKKLTFFAAAFALFFSVSCSSDNAGNTEIATTDEHGHAHHEGMAHEDEPAATQVAAVPDYSSVAAPFKSDVSQLLDKYLVVKDALVASNADAAQKAGSQVVTAAKALPVATLQVHDQKPFAEAQREKMLEAAAGIASATDLEAQRDHFEELSEAVFALTKAFDAAENGLYYQHCPMALNDKGAYWLSTNEEIRNPYFGDKMLKCGSNVEELN